MVVFLSGLLEKGYLLPQFTAGVAGFIVNIQCGKSVDCVFSQGMDLSVGRCLLVKNSLTSI